jgi:hypothetical protein
MRYAALLTCVLVLACTDQITTPDPSFELVNPAERIQGINAHVYGSFAVAAGGGIILSGPANFPGHPPAGPGTCDNGLWINAQGKRTSGSATKPHPHCFSKTAAIEVVLEPISACYSGAQGEVGEPAQPPAAEPAAEEPAEPAEPPTKPGSGCRGVLAVKGATNTELAFRYRKVENKVVLWEDAVVTSLDWNDNTFQPDNTVGTGKITAYAIDAATLGTTNKRVGTLTIDLAQYNNKIAYLHLNDAAGCNIDETIESPCLNLPIMAKYNPLPAPDGLGPTDFSVEGFLWVTPANSPYNYTDMP